MERLTIPDTPIEGGIRRAIIDGRAVREEAMTIYWALKKYEDTGLTPDQIREIDRLYLEKCQEANALLEENRWIPVSERLPDSEENEKYYDMVIISLDNLRVVSGFYRDDVGIWFGNLEGTIYKKITSKVIAWMPLPEPYRSEILR